jgi:hypothetical protein
MKFSNLLCKIFGHKIDWPQAPFDYRIAQCKRCGVTRAEQYGEEPFTAVEHHGIFTPLIWLRSKSVEMKDRIKQFFAPCSDCGRRFNRHDNSIDHLPF